MKRFLAVVALSFGLLGCLPPAHAADTSTLCSLGTDSTAVKSLNLNSDQVAILHKACVTESDNLVKAASDKVKSDTKTLADAKVKAKETVATTTVAATPIPDEGFGKKFTDGINSVVNTIAGAIASTAKQLNVTVNEFIKSPAGMLVILFIFAKFFGYTVFKFIITLFFWWFITRLYVWAVRRSLEYTATFEPRKVLWGLFTYQKKISATYAKFDAIGESAGMIFNISTICYSVFTIIVMCNII